MLPFANFHGICSLNPLGQTCIPVDMEIDREGDVVRHEIYESIINSQGQNDIHGVSICWKKTTER